LYWHHWCLVYDGSQATNTNRIKFYFDGTSVALNFGGTLPTTTPNISGTNARLGRSGLRLTVTEFPARNSAETPHRPGQIQGLNSPAHPLS
jgi:hypothetical protein